MRRGITDIQELLDANRSAPSFVRISQYSRDFEQKLIKIYDAARQNGVILEGRIPNPTDSNLSYYYEMMGNDFRLDRAFLSASLMKWLPRISRKQHDLITDSLLSTLMQMRDVGKTDSMLKNAYIRFMCWLYFKFERVAIRLGDGTFPMILIQADISGFELNFLSILCEAGCDVVLIQTSGDESYLKIDPASASSFSLAIPGGGAFPKDFSINKVYRMYFEQQYRRPQSAAARPVQQAPRVQNVQQAVQNTVEQPLRIPEAEYTVCPNAWMQVDLFDCLLLSSAKRGDDPKLIYTCFACRDGVEDRLVYPNELIQLHQKLLEVGRKPMIVNDGFAQPTPEEIQQIRRGSYRSINEAIIGLATNLQSGTALGLQSIATRAFMQILSEEGKKAGANPNRISSTAVYLLCWFKRCYAQLFEGWKPKQIGCLIYMGGVRNEREALFLRFLSKLPTDILVLKPNLEENNCLEDSMLFTQSYQESMVMKTFPQESSSLRVSTAASQAERDLDGTLYNNTGLYRNRQFDAAQSVVLNSTYEEIALYWDQELKYRPNFNTVNNTVMMPVLFAQASGVKNGDVGAYWLSIKQLITPETIVIKQFPMFRQEDMASIASNAVEFFRNGRLQREKIKKHRQYPFAMLREETQEYILNKLQVLIDQKTIRGTMENGMEYHIISTVLSLKKEWVRMIQKFDFTRKNPKVLCICTTEQMATKEDAILLAFMSLIGFDVVCFVPTGYQCFGQWYASGTLVEHQVGDYVYDLSIPDFNLVTQNTHSVWNIFKRGS